ncbi:MAG TPA: two-component regulator propeller domain-containing protein [Ohtaekwangia sp.]|uniref:sensor histidine kinase n=1 Tax=Ohtaekwangia sp. TaxID=2066019 RepID=UPI002F94EFC5
MRRLARCMVLSCAIASLLYHTAQSQEHDIRFHHITVDDGLPSNTVNGVIRDSRGFIWIASENGVIRYDGYAFVNFRVNEQDTASISSNITYTILEDSEARLWVGSEKGLDLFNRNTDAFDKHFFNGIPVRALFEDSRKQVWIGSDQGLYRYEPQGGNFIKPYKEMFDPKEVIYNTIPSITEDRQGNLWVGTSHGAYIYETARQAFRQFLHNEAIPGSLSENNVRKIVEDHTGRMWIATYGGGLNLYLPETGTFKIYRHDAADNRSISGDLIPALWVNDDGKLWIGTDGQGIDIMDPETRIFHHVVHSSYNSKSLNNNVIRSISSDHRGGVWIGTYTGGINFFNQNAEAFFHFKVPTSNGNSSVTSFAEEANGNLWIGTDGGGLCYFNRVTGQFQNYSHDEKNANSLSDNRVISLQLDERGKLWIGTYLGGLCMYNPATRKFKRYTDQDGSGLSDNVIWSLLLDDQQTIWAGTNKGLNHFDPRTGKFTSFDIANSNLSNNMVRCLYEDDRRRLWIGTQEGLNLLEAPYRHFTVMKREQQKENSLSNHWIRTIHQDHAGRLWIGTFAGGLDLFDEASGRFIAFSESDGLPDNIISGIIGDDHDNVWISTGRGLAHLDMQTRTFRIYNESDGLQNYQFNINACFKTQRGEFLFGGTNGFTLFVPDVIKGVTSNPYPPPVALTSFKVFNKDVQPCQDNSPLTAPIHETKAITLSYDQSVLTFEFAALNFIQPEKNQYAYKLSGFEKNWNMVGDKRSATYTNLEPGEYIFQVKASNNDGVWNESGTSLIITITPPFWGTWWFRILLALLAVATVWLIVNIVRERIREKIRINKLISELELKALIAQMNPHFIFNCLTSIQELIAVHKQDEAMHYLHQFSRLLRTVLKSSEKNFIPLEEELTLLELYLELESMRFDKQFHYTITVDEAIDPEEVLIPSFLLQPFVENALWHGLMHKKGERNLRVTFTLHSHDVMECRIQDNGIGRAEAAVIRKRSLKTYKSMGIKIIRDRISLMKKQNDWFGLQIIDDKDEAGNARGTTVLVNIPLGNSLMLHHTKVAENEPLSVSR